MRVIPFRLQSVVRMARLTKKNRSVLHRHLRLQKLDHPRPPMNTFSRIGPGAKTFYSCVKCTSLRWRLLFPMAWRMDFSHHHRNYITKPPRLMNSPPPASPSARVAGRRYPRPAAFCLDEDEAVFHNALHVARFPHAQWNLRRPLYFDESTFGA